MHRAAPRRDAEHLRAGAVGPRHVARRCQVVTSAATSLPIPVLKWEDDGSALVVVRVAPEVSEARAGDDGRLGGNGVALEETATADGQWRGDRQGGAPEMTQVDVGGGVLNHSSRVAWTQDDQPLFIGVRWRLVAVQALSLK